MRILSLAFLLALAAAVRAEDENPDVQYHGSGWIQFGEIEHSSDTVSNQPDNNFNGNWIQSTGGQITAVVKMGDNWEGGVGLGAIQTHAARGAFFVSNLWIPTWAPLVEARVSYSENIGPASVRLTMGSFPYDYNPDVKNLGLYLLRGQVYPGTVISGFETKHVLPIASVYGALAHAQWGAFQNDVILNSETETKPYFDFSLADIASWQIAPGLQVGAGVNFYRLFQQNRNVTSPPKSCSSEAHSYHQEEDGATESCFSLDTVSRHVARMDTSVAYVTDAAGVKHDSALLISPVIDGAVVDTVTGSMGGIKLMARFHLDPKAWMSSTSLFGKEDLIVYGEAALLGVRNQGKYYDNPWRRIPVMVGFNLPAFKLLDKLSLEVEYYGSLNYSDYGKAESYGSWVPRTVSHAAIESSAPISYSPDGANTYVYDKVQVMRNLDNSRDNWKWSLYGSRVLMGHLRLAAQVADDHYRNGGVAATTYPTWAEALTTPADWYWMCKLAYFF
jgi:hypothetical protein